MSHKLCDRDEAKGRLTKAEQFFGAAEDIRMLADEESDIGDAYVTLCVHAGIAAADAICCAQLGERSQGQNHNEAAALIKQVRPNGNALAKSLSTLLQFKSRAGYSSRPVNAEMRKKSRAAAQRLLDTTSSLI